MILPDPEARRDGVAGGEISSRGLEIHRFPHTVLSKGYDLTRDLVGQLSPGSGEGQSFEKIEQGSRYEWVGDRASVQSSVGAAGLLADDPGARSTAQRQR